MGSLSIAFDKKRAKKFGMRLKTVVTLHRQKDLSVSRQTGKRRKPKGN
jgi:hypothetical protein